MWFTSGLTAVVSTERKELKICSNSGNEAIVIGVQTSFLHPHVAESDCGMNLGTYTGGGSVFHLTDYEINRTTAHTTIIMQY